MSDEVKKTDQWERLKQFTNARIGLGNVGSGMPLREVLALKLAHAEAKDAIFTTLDIDHLKSKSRELGVSCYEFKSHINDREEYLRRPDLGKKLRKNTDFERQKPVDILFVITDGLSASAVNKNAFTVLDFIIPELTEYTVAVAIVEQGRVAVGDEVAALFDASFVAILIGERPGLSSPESMGIYTTYQPKPGFTDEKRNCISNVHPNGLQDHQAATLLRFLIRQSFSLKMSGVGLKIDLKGLGSK